MRLRDAYGVIFKDDPLGEVSHHGRFMGVLKEDITMAIGPPSHAI